MEVSCFPCRARTTIYFYKNPKTNLLNQWWVLRIAKVNSVVHFTVQVDGRQRTTYSVVVGERRAAIYLQVVGAITVARIILDATSLTFQPVMIGARRHAGHTAPKVNGNQFFGRKMTIRLVDLAVANGDLRKEWRKKGSNFCLFETFWLFSNWHSTHYERHRTTADCGKIMSKKKGQIDYKLKVK